MENNDFDKRMELLKKSYDRIPSSFDSEKVLLKIEEESNKRPNEKPIFKKSGEFRHKVTVWAVSLASIFVIGFLTATFFLTEKRELAENTDDEITEQFLLELEKSYKEEREKRQKMLKMPEENFDELSFIKLADDRVHFLMNSEFAIRTIPSRKAMEVEVEMAVKRLKLPSEMVEELLSNPLTSDEDASIAFMAEYRDRVNALINAYNVILNESQRVKDELNASSRIDKNERINNLNQQFREMYNGMKYQNIIFFENDFMEFTNASYEMPEIYLSISNSLHEHVRGYFTMLIKEPFLEHAWLKDSIELTADNMLDLQHTLIHVKRDSTLYPASYSYYATLFYLLVKGSEYNRIFDEGGIVKPEYQQVWKRISRELGTIPTVYLMVPIVEEMEASGWRNSKSWDEFDWYKIEEAMNLARDGKLEAFMQDGSIDEKMQKVSMPDEQFKTSVKAIYEVYLKERDGKVLREAKPVEIIGLYYFAEELQDYETQHALFIGPEYEYYVEKDEYVRNAKISSSPDFKFDEYFSELNYVDDVGVDESGNKFGSVFVLVNAVSFPWVDPLQGFWMKETKDGWRIILTPNF